jgi:error-prone DNA polymerase
MKEVEKKLQLGMEKNGIVPEVQEKIIRSITSFALYGFPESHAASFALLAYASAYLKCRYLAAFTAAMLNNQPMGFYHAATLVKDAQRHGLRVKSIDIARSDWLCTLEKVGEAEREFILRVGLRYVKGLRQEIAVEIVRQRAARPFTSIEDLKLRVPDVRKAELTTLAAIGALNFIAGKHGASQRGTHRRDALWQIERAARRPGRLFEVPDNRAEQFEGPVSDDAPPTRENPTTAASPLLQMTVEERLTADFHGTGMTVGPHPMAYHRAEMKKQGIRSAIELPKLRNGMTVRVAGSVIARQRPGTAKGFVFLSMEDETGIANAIITPQIFQENRATIVQHQFLLIEGILQNQENVISVKAQSIWPLLITRAETSSHDFH